MKHLFFSVVLFCTIPEAVQYFGAQIEVFQKTPFGCPKGWVRVSRPQKHDFKESIDNGFKYYRTVSKTKRILVGIETLIPDIGAKVIYWDKTKLDD
jgi:hypothetical protein